MVKDHKSKTGLNVPEWVKNAWHTRNKDELARILLDHNGDKERSLCCFLIINCMALALPQLTIYRYTDILILYIYIKAIHQSSKNCNNLNGLRVLVRKIWTPGTIYIMNHDLLGGVGQKNKPIKPTSSQCILTHVPATPCA